MKVIFILLFLSAINCSSQTIIATAIREEWANGHCCAHGVNYTITIHTSSVNPDSVKIVSACVDQKFFQKSQIKRIKCNKKNKVMLVLSWSENNEEDEIVDNNNKSKNKKLPFCNGKNKLVVQLQKKYETIGIKIIKDYPPIPYP